MKLTPNVPPPPFVLPAVPGAVLIDNSTYFSAAAALNQTAFDADTIHNLALYLESLVFAETLLTSPTLAWHPASADDLFVSGICRQVTFESLTLPQRRALYQNALSEAIYDVNQGRDFGGVKLTAAYRGAALKRLAEWQLLSEHDPDEFAAVYSGAVYITDAASRQKVSRLSTGVTAQMPVDRQVAQYLLRTNVAVQLSTAFAYLPHSHRARFVANKLRHRSEAQRSALALIRDAETAIASSLHARRVSAFLQHLPAYQTPAVTLPLVFAAVLVDAKSPADLVQKALEIRQWRSARAYRQFAHLLIQAIRESTERAHVERLDSRLEASRQLLEKELAELFGPRDTGLFANTLRVLGGVKLIARFNLEDAYGELISVAPWLAERLQAWDPRYRHVAVLTRLARKRQQIVDLNRRLVTVFGKRLSDDQMFRLSQLAGGRSGV